MQPLYSVDHETRHHSSRTDDNVPTTSSREDTPLLHRFPQDHQHSERNLLTTVTVALLLIILITGVVIGVYLLILQNNSENILPPVDSTSLQLVSRKQWDHLADSTPVSSIAPVKAKQVIIVQTDTEPCSSTDSCTRLLQKMQDNNTTVDQLSSYNFLVSTNGQTYESLGWHRPSPMFPAYPNSLVLAFIGNFTESPPSEVQIDEAKNLFAESLSQQHLEPTYVIFGKITKYDPTCLFSSLKNLPQWSRELTDVKT